MEEKRVKRAVCLFCKIKLKIVREVPVVYL